MSIKKPPRVVVITGASGGIGRASARLFAQQGDHVALLARGSTGLEAAARDVRDLGGDALTICVDTADHETLERAADRVEAELGAIDVWVNDAFTSVFARFIEIEPEEFRRVTEVSYLGFVNGTRTALKRMLPRDSGVIVQVGSALAHRGIPLQSAYCGGKFAVRGFTDSVRTELLHNHSRVWISMVQLPAVNTPQFSWCRSKLPDHPQPVAPIFQPEVPAEAVYWAAHHRRREITVGASAIKAIIGDKLAPRAADWYLARTGYASQQITDMPIDPGRPDNLFEPVPSLAATHGMFDDRAHPRSYQLRATTHRRLITGVLAGAGTVATVLGLRRR